MKAEFKDGKFTVKYSENEFEKECNFYFTLNSEDFSYTLNASHEVLMDLVDLINSVK